MASIVIATYGTLGDNLPYIALGKALKDRGHCVCMVINESMRIYARKAGLETVSCGLPILDSQEARQRAKEWNHLSGIEMMSHKQIYRLLHNYIIESFPHLLQVCKNSDILISSTQQELVAKLVQEKTNIFWLKTCVIPFLFCNNFTNIVNSREYSNQLFWDVRRTLGLAEQRQNLQKNNSEFDCSILGASQHFCKLSPQYSHIKMTGFWFYEDPEWKNWQPDSDLKKFVEQDPKPLVLSFSSLPVENPYSVVEVHVRAAAKLGRRILIQQGWSNFNTSHLPSDICLDDVKFAGFMPQDWLFSHADAVIHHGGIGITARALRNGCPTLVEPYGNDQFFNARQTLLLGVGAAMHPDRLTVDEITCVLAEKVLTSSYRKRASELGEKIVKEQSLDTACDLIESYLREV